MFKRATNLNFDLRRGEQLYEFRDNLRVDDELDVVVAGVCEVGECPDGVHQYVGVGVVDEDTEGRQQTLHGV